MGSRNSQECLDGTYFIILFTSDENNELSSSQFTWFTIFIRFSVRFPVTQVCSEDGMEFTLRTPEGFLGRIYTHGYYDRCFYRGNGGTANVLRISGAQGYPDCGTQRVILL